MMERGLTSLGMIIMSILISLLVNAQDGWKELGSGNAGLNPNAHFLTTATDHSGNVYGAGLFTNASGHTYVAKWDGTSGRRLVLVLIR
jgi:hypothetical protein